MLRQLFILTAFCTALAPALASAPAAAASTQLADERALIAVADGLDAAVDAKDWTTARGFFADEVRIDFSSLGGGAPATIPSDDLIGAWRANLFAAKQSFHLRGNHLVQIDGDTAQMTSHGYAWNKLAGLAGGELWEVWGTYDYRFARTAAGWKLTHFTFNMIHERGNPAVRTATETD